MVELMTPLQAIEHDPPNVWLTSFYGFSPETWGFLGFTTSTQRKSFINRSRPGVLVAVYGTGEAPADELGKLIGVLQCSHRVDHASKFMLPEAFAKKAARKEQKDNWNLGVKAVRAWRIPARDRPSIAEFADQTYSPTRAQVIGSQGMPLSAKEAAKLLALPLQEITVFGETAVLAAAIGWGSEIFAPSKPGPVSQNAFVVKESEGPKHLYVLELQGDLSAFLGRQIDREQVVKVGMSSSPHTRCIDHNRAWPRCAFSWKVRTSTDVLGYAPFPTSRVAIEGESEMKRQLATNGASLGGEFFVARDDAIETAWEAGLAAARHLMVS